MEKRVSEWKKQESGVLYETSEPLFANTVNWRRIRLIRAAFAAVCAVAVLCAVVILSVRVAALFDGEGNGGAYPFEENTTVSEQSTVERTEDSEWHGGYVTEPPADSETESRKNEHTANEEMTDESGSVEDTDTDIEESIVIQDIADANDLLGHVINLSDKDIDVDALLDSGFMYKESSGNPAPLVMVIHTHTSEEYIKEGSSFKGLNSVVSVGESINQTLNAAGLSAIHCTVIHDAGDDNAYVAARETIKTMLMIYPSVKYIIDVHRMDRQENGQTVKTLSAVDTAQMRITVSADGTMGRNWQDGLALAVALRQELNEDGRALCAPTVLSAARYNSDLCRYYMMLEVGTQGNTTQEAMSAGEYFAKALLSVLLAR